MSSSTSLLLIVVIVSLLAGVTEAQLFDLCTILTALYRIFLGCPGSGNGLCDFVHFLFHATNCPEIRLLDDANQGSNLLEILKQ
ncbi:hypothetical protein RRG08_041272 [Elysia crispata]|uniref:Uncharacterized protein n=1 Tax=Elysia crispata TaxID=231223 RepID=A0AAE1AVH5_9GAST|nr:hypothetical protein RRG08_041272 [Elysia crispata]